MGEVHERLREKHERRRKIKLWAGFGLGFIALMGSIYWLSSIGPKAASEGTDLHLEIDQPRIEQLRGEVAALMLRFDEAEARTEGQVAEAELLLLQEAVQKQQELAGITRQFGMSDDSAYLRELQSRLSNYLAAPLNQESRSAEDLAREALRDEDFKLAAENLKRALALQKQIHDEFSSSRYVSASRLAMLERETREALALPLYHRSSEAEARAEALVEQGELDKAEDAWREARMLQEQLINQLPQSQHARVSRLQRLDSRLHELQALKAAQEVTAKLAAAEAAFERGEATAAADLYAEAIQIQHTINNSFSGTRAASRERVEELESRRQTAASAVVGKRILTNLAAMDEALRGRQALAVQSLAGELHRDLSLIEQRFPRSTHINEETRMRIRYLHAMARTVAPIQAAVLERLQPILGMPGVAMFENEVSQLLFEQVMRSNPSASRGENLPVDSVTLAEAHEFCQRLSWVLARPVRLPTIEEFRAAVGTPTSSQVRDGSWNSSTSADRQPQPVATSPKSALGFHDLLGNVAEWIQADPGAETATVIGGSVRDNPLRLVDIPQEERPATERQRYTGFRIVVLDVGSDSL